MRSDNFEKKESSSQYIGVTYHDKTQKWRAQRYSKFEKKMSSNGYYEKEETAAHASDTLAKKLIESGKLKLKLNFPDDDTEVYREKDVTAGYYFSRDFH